MSKHSRFDDFLSNMDFGSLPPLPGTSEETQEMPSMSDGLPSCENVHPLINEIGFELNDAVNAGLGYDQLLSTLARQYITCDKGMFEAIAKSYLTHISPATDDAYSESPAEYIIDEKDLADMLENLVKYIIFVYTRVAGKWYEKHSPLKD